MFGLFSKVIKVVTHHILPEYKTSGAACFDISVYTNKTLKPNELFNFPTDLRVEIPKGWCILIFARSSLGQKKCIIPNSVGVIDSDYRGEIKVPILNLSQMEVSFEIGQRVAQAMLIKAKQCSLLKVDYLSDTERGIGGFGSTGR